MSHLLQSLASSALLGRGGSSIFLGIFCFRLSLLAGRVAGFESASTSLEVERLAAAADLPSAGLARERPGAMVVGGSCELEDA